MILCFSIKVIISEKYQVSKKNQLLMLGFLTLSGVAGLDFLCYNGPIR